MNNRRTSKSISIKSRGSDINLHPLIVKLLDEKKKKKKKKVLKKEYKFHEAQ